MRLFVEQVTPNTQAVLSEASWLPSTQVHRRKKSPYRAGLASQEAPVLGQPMGGAIGSKCYPAEQRCALA